MKAQPTLETPRLLLRTFTLDDAHTVQKLAGAREVAAVTLNVPHPYEDGMAEQWIGGQQGDWEQGKSVVYAVVLREGDDLIGCISIGINREFQHGELGYWLGVPFWGQGYATEAARAIVGFGFESLGLHRIYARHLVGNPASGRVMEKIGMRYEGRLRQHYCKWGQFHDSVIRGILSSEWKQI